MARRTVTGGLSLLAVAGAGALAMYLLDPEKGRQRRQNLTGALGDLTSQARTYGQHLADQAAHLAAGAAAKTGEVLESATGSAHHAASDLSQNLREKAHEYAEKLGDMAGRARRYVASAHEHIHEHAGEAIHDLRARLGPQEEYYAATGYLATAATAVGLGLGAMYLFDPVEGRHRRATLMESAGGAVCHTGNAFRSTGQYLRQQFSQVAAEVRGETNYPGRAGFPWPATARLGLGVAGGALGFYGATRRDWIGLTLGTAGLGMIAAGFLRYDFNRLGQSASEIGHKAANLARHHGPKHHYRTDFSENAMSPAQT